MTTISTLWIICLIAGLLVLSIMLYKIKKNGHCRLTLALKVIASLIFVAFAVSAICFNADLTCFDPAPSVSYTTYINKWFILIGLVISLCADLIIGLRHIQTKQKLKDLYFVLGAALFLCAHIFYIFSYLLPLNIMTIAFASSTLISIVLFGCLAFLWKLELKKGAVMIVYFSFIISLVVVAIIKFVYASETIVANTENYAPQLFATFSILAFPLGAAIFFASDLFLVVGAFGAQTKRTKEICGTLCFLLYFVAQMLLAACTAL